tara:strand:+ start:358 stop:822 length:465 start_codon:yes stop_codon:yes gene_type:complete
MLDRLGSGGIILETPGLEINDLDEGYLTSPPSDHHAIDPASDQLTINMVENGPFVENLEPITASILIGSSSKTPGNGWIVHGRFKYTNGFFPLSLSRSLACSHRGMNECPLQMLLAWSSIFKPFDFSEELVNQNTTTAGTGIPDTELVTELLLG